MLLSRIIDHVKEQNWTAIVIDFFIVVMGVFIGIQLGNWNDARKTYARAEIYAERLLNDLHVEFEYAVSLRDYFAHVRDDAVAAFDGLSGKSDLDDRTILINAFRASQTQWYERRRAAFDELVSSGELELITDTTLRQTAVSFYSNSETMYQIMRSDQQDAGYRRLFARLVDPDIQLALERDCGDKEYTSPSGVSGLLTIAYDCTAASVDDAAVKKALDALRADPEVLPTLRQKTVDSNTSVVNIDYMFEQSGAKALMAQGEKK